MWATPYSTAASASPAARTRATHRSLRRSTAPPAVDVDVSAYTPEQLAVLVGRAAGALKTQALTDRAARDALTLEVEEMELEHVQHLLRREQRDTSGDEEAVRGRLIELLLEEPRE